MASLAPEVDSQAPEVDSQALAEDLRVAAEKYNRLCAILSAVEFQITQQQSVPKTTADATEVARNFISTIDYSKISSLECPHLKTIISNMSNELMIDVLALYSGKLTGTLGQQFEDTLRDWKSLPPRHAINGVGVRIVISINEMVHNDLHLARRLLCFVLWGLSPATKGNLRAEAE